MPRYYINTDVVAKTPERALRIFRDWLYREDALDLIEEDTTDPPTGTYPGTYIPEDHPRGWKPIGGKGAYQP